MWGSVAKTFLKIKTSELTVVVLKRSFPLSKLCTRITNARLLHCDWFRLIYPDRQTFMNKSIYILANLSENVQFLTKKMLKFVFFGNYIFICLSCIEKTKNKEQTKNKIEFSFTQNSKNGEYTNI